MKFLKQLLEHRHLPVFMALGAIVLMLPALKMGLFADDLPQRAIALKPSQLPPGIQATGNPADSGSLATVTRDFFFGAYREPHYLELSKRYGMLPWWTPDSLRLGLWRPVTAFTHWLDYRLYPDSPALMHTQNIAWFAAILFLLTIIYRRLMNVRWAAGLAALLFLLDGNTYFPVMFVANRGFIMSLFFGLLSFYEHHRWRSEKSRWALAWSALFLGASLLADEGGASSFAFILAYALVLEPGHFGKRALTIVPAVLVIVAWRIVYESLGSGLHDMHMYIDPAHEPLQFATAVIPRALVLLGGQISQIPPECLFVVKPALLPRFQALYGVPIVILLLVFLPLLRRDKTSGFWLAVMIFAAIPAATVVPLSKNLGFVAVGCYGLMATFIARLCEPGASSNLETRSSKRETRNSELAVAPRPSSPIYRVVAWAFAIVLLIAHVPGALFGRVVQARYTPDVLARLKYLDNICDPPAAENRHIVVLNSPCCLFQAYAPFTKAYYHQPLPKSIRTLVPGCTGFAIERPDESTLVLQSRGPNIFSTDELGPFSAVYGVAVSSVILGTTKAKPGDQYDLGIMKVEILQTDVSGAPSRVAFHFDRSVDSPDFVWIQFDWETGGYEKFAVPAIGQCASLSGPAPWR